MGQTDMFKLVQHLIVQDDGKLPPIPDCLYAYIMAGNGVFLYAKRDDLEVLIPVSRATIAGLPPLEPFVNMPRVPAILMHHILQASKENLPNEILFWFNFDHDRQVWNLDAPLQILPPCQCVPRGQKRPARHQGADRPAQSRPDGPVLQPHRQQRRAGFQDLCGDRESERETRNPVCAWVCTATTGTFQQT